MSDFQPKLPPISTEGYQPLWLEVETAVTAIQAGANAIGERMHILRDVLDCYAFDEPPPKALDTLERYALLLGAIDRGIAAMHLTLHAAVSARAEEEEGDDD